MADSISQQILNLQQKLATYQEQTAYYASQVQKYRDLTNQCKAARDSKSSGWAKNNACHIDTYTSYSNNWAAYQNEYNKNVEAIKTLTAAIAQLQAQIQTSAEIERTQFESTPEYLQTVNAGIAAQDAEGKRKERFWIIVAIVVVILAIVAYLYFKNRKG